MRGIHRWPTKRLGTRSFDIFFELRLNKRLSKQSRGWWFETPSVSLWRHRNEMSTHAIHLVYYGQGSNTGSAPIRCLHITWNNAVLFSIEPLGIDVSEVWTSTCHNVFHSWNAFQKSICKMAALLSFQHIKLPSIFRDECVQSKLWQQQMSDFNFDDNPVGFRVAWLINHAVIE